MGYSCDYTSFSGKKLHLSLASNPSHLEFVNPVVEGMAKAKQRRAVAYWNKSDEQAKKEVIPILIHGDAAFSGQGICYETVQLSKVKGFNCGGTVHIIINNQIGFTTDWKDSRSTAFASDMIKMIDAPVFHVNGDDLEAVCAVGRLASKIRQKFNIDVMIDLVCYRKYGHNEGDEPSFTQPLMYKKIKSKLSPKKIYEQKLLAEKVTSQDYFETINQQINEKLQKSYEISKEKKTDSGHVVSVYQGAWYGYRSAKDEDFEKSISTGVNAETLKNLAKKIFTPPQDFNVHPKLKKLLELRLNQVIEGKNIEWGVGELLAYASLIQEGSHVRLTGQDAERGTFSHRHAVLTDYENGRKLNLLNDINPKLGFSVYNSILSEAACLGFEYGFASADPTSLTIWEAQFGDFANGAQVIIDQFISSAETKWQRMNGVVLLLPHGFEGQGPEHSSARLERFLQLCAENNIQVCNLTLPSQIFHVLRRQVKREFRKPLIIMSPKKLLRLEAAVSSLSEFIEGTRFLEVIDDVRKNYEARKLIFCTGKVYYELQEVMQLKNIQDIAVVRIEQLYPFPKNQIQNLLKQYSKVKEYIWLQEEPKNQGAWSFVRDVFEEFYNLRLKYVGRQPSAAPACGSEEKSKKEQEILLNEAINL
jgi:2-oxoglutarate dehydrogenase E1 component